MERTLPLTESPSQPVATLRSAQHPIRQPRPDRGQSVASDPRHLNIAAIHEAPATFTYLRVNQTTRHVLSWSSSFMSGNGYLELQNINMGSEAKKVDLASHFIRTTSIACSSEPQVF